MKNGYRVGLVTVIAVAALSGQAAKAADAAPLHTWLIPDAASLRLAAPPDDTTTKDEIDQLKALAAERDDGDMEQIRFWNSGSPGYRWIQIAQQEVAKHGLGGPAATRAMALVAVAINDATAAAWDSKYAYHRPRPSQVDATVEPVIPVPNSPSYPSLHAAVAAAASATLDYLFPDRADAFDAMAAEAAQSRLYANTEFPSDVVSGMGLGKSVGDAAISWAKADGSDAVFTGLFPPTPGQWSSPNPSFPLGGNWRPWALKSGRDLRLVPPPAFGSPEFTAQVDAVKNQARTTDTNRTAWIWQASFIDPWIDTLNRYLFETRLGDDAPGAAQAYALMLAAQHDATIACWDTKYAYLELRPIQADPQIATSFGTPAHPSYPSGHACASGAAGAVLAALFPQDAQYFADRAREAGLSTFYAGIHYPNDVDQGLVLGQNVGAAILERGGATNVQTTR